MATTKMPLYSILLQKAHHFFLVLCGLYVLLLVLGVIPFMQRECVCLLHSFLAFLIQSFDCRLISLFRPQTHLHAQHQITSLSSVRHAGEA
jgi:hypothetical protein